MGLKNDIKNIYLQVIRFFPIQLFLLHFRKYQSLLLIWIFIIGVLNGTILDLFGIDKLLVAPQYFEDISFWSYLILGFCFCTFFICWNICTFILHSKRFLFLATTHRPFLKYCVNNSIIPIIVLGYYLVKIYEYQRNENFSDTVSTFGSIAGFIIGFCICLLISFAYFFGADKGIVKKLKPQLETDKYKVLKEEENNIDRFGLKISYFISDKFRLRKAKQIKHIKPEFLELIFSSHHFSAIVSIFLAFLFLVISGIFIDNALFKVPAAASFFIILTLTIGLVSALTYFLESWSILFFIAVVFVVNQLYVHDFIDPRNKAYGLNYENKNLRPAYNKQSLNSLCLPDSIEKDKKHMLTILNNWKAKQKEEKPKIYFITVSGGGLRSACFVTHILQQVDSVFNGSLMDKTVLISGASGGMLAAAYYRSWAHKYKYKILDDSLKKEAVNNITKDLLNPVMSSLALRDLFAPVKTFNYKNQKYIKDRGFAFEERFNDNTENFFDASLSEIKPLEISAEIPMCFISTTISADGRRLLISPQPISYMMKSESIINDTNFSVDAIDFGALFKNQNAENLRLSSALRMNATFPYVLPNVWLPTQPIIDVMDAGLRDNYGNDACFRFIYTFKDWIKENTSGIEIIQIRDRQKDNWYRPYIMNNISDVVVKPGTILQQNFHKTQDYAQADQLTYLASNFETGFLKRYVFEYLPYDLSNQAALNFHISTREKNDILNSARTNTNAELLKQLK